MYLLLWQSLQDQIWILVDTLKEKTHDMPDILQQAFKVLVRKPPKLSEYVPIYFNKVNILESWCSMGHLPLGLLAWAALDPQDLSLAGSRSGKINVKYMYNIHL